MPMSTPEHEDEKTKQVLSPQKNPFDSHGHWNAKTFSCHFAAVTVDHTVCLAFHIGLYSSGRILLECLYRKGIFEAMLDRAKMVGA